VITAKAFQKILSKEIKATESKVHNTHKIHPNPSEIRSHMNQLRRTNPALRNSYNSTVDSINSKHLDENGMKIALKELAKRWVPEVHKSFTKRSKHIALEDVKDSIQELKHYREFLLKI
jgi:hypothetical protein